MYFANSLHMIGYTLSVLGHSEQKGIKDMQNWEVIQFIFEL